ncbi:MAG: hypothetical protein RR317_03145 [Bilophila sp.]
MFTLFTHMPMDAAVCLALVTLGVSFIMSLFGLVRAIKPARSTGVHHAR